MGQYKFWISFKKQIGLRIWENKCEFGLDFLCFRFLYGRTENANGLYLFKK